MKDELGGTHVNGLSINPNGVPCGLCNKESCHMCKNQNKTDKRWYNLPVDSQKVKMLAAQVEHMSDEEVFLKKAEIFSAIQPIIDFYTCA